MSGFVRVPVALAQVPPVDWIDRAELDAHDNALAGDITALDARTTAAEGTLSTLGGLVFPALQLPAPIAAGAAPNNSEFRDLSNRMKRKDNSGNVIGRRFPLVIDLYGAQPQVALALTGPTANSYSGWPGDAASGSLFEFYAGMDVRVVYAVWQVAWTPGGAAAGIRLVSADPGPVVDAQLAEITGVTGGPRNDSALVTSAIQTIVDGIDDLTVGVGPHKQIGHQLKGTGAVAPKVFLSRVSILFEA